MPNLNWTSEIVPIKQSLGVMIALFGGWAIIAAFAVIYVFLNNIFNPLTYLFIIFGLLLFASCILLYWLFTRGAKIFSRL